MKKKVIVLIGVILALSLIVVLATKVLDTDHGGRLKDGTYYLMNEDGSVMKEQYLEVKDETVKFTNVDLDKEYAEFALEHYYAYLTKGDDEKLSQSEREEIAKSVNITAMFSDSPVAIYSHKIMVEKHVYEGFIAELLPGTNLAYRYHTKENTISFLRGGDISLCFAMRE